MKNLMIIYIKKEYKIIILSILCIVFGILVSYGSLATHKNIYKMVYINKIQPITIGNHQLISYSIAGYPIIVDERDRIIAQSIINSHSWEGHVTNALKRLVHEGDTVVEVGSNYGYHTILLGKIIGSTGHLYSYEANSDVCNILNKNIVLNNLSNNVTIRCTAVSDKEQQAKFLTGYSNLGGAFVVGKYANLANIKHSEAYKDWITTTVDTTYLDQDLSTLKNIDVLRMDAEGSELAVINGARNLISLSKKIKIIMEWHIGMLSNFGSVETLLDNLESDHFNFYLINDNGTLTKKNKDEMFTIPHCSDVVITRDKL